MDENAIIYEFEELPDFSSMELEPWGMPKDWGFVVMGTSLKHRGIPDRSHVIMFREIVDDEVVEHVYPIPRTVKFLMRHDNLQGYKEAKQQIRSALGI